ncbi:MAG TPA: type VI secretion system tube protein Hcp [Terriglobales bacterium]|nr:type VI secretion system tube protein Hcp [Terriglobales bacterium]
MAVNAYLKIDGVTGQAKAKAGHIDVQSFSFGVSQSVHPGSQGEDKHSGKADFSCVNVSKVVDKTSTDLFVACAKGHVFPNIKLVYDKPTKGGKQEEYFYLELTNAVIANANYGAGSEHPSEQLSFSFDKIKMGYKAEKPDGSLDGWVEKYYDAVKLQNG